MYNQCPSSVNRQLGNLKPHERKGEETEKCPERNKEMMYAISWRDKKQVTLMRVETIFRKFLRRLKIRWLTVGPHIMLRADNRWTKRTPE